MKKQVVVKEEVCPCDCLLLLSREEQPPVLPPIVVVLLSSANLNITRIKEVNLNIQEGIFK